MILSITKRGIWALIIRVTLSYGHTITITKLYLSYNIISCFRCLKIYKITGKNRKEWSKQLGCEYVIKPKTRISEEN